MANSSCQLEGIFNVLNQKLERLHSASTPKTCGRVPFRRSSDGKDTPEFPTNSKQFHITSRSVQLILVDTGADFRYAM
ncbi:uncharacterized protein RSE6_13000 [Rhynchosporium secalis]|uniref:Uncharacterized protein n=1 Tax=Rhynchosporium secalis TaxID=38038 RepID=A0A1E1MRT3_RHYSE|nr:uncharacterized protein RSE6_13000 [Rhynchosporium secalis]